MLVIHRSPPTSDANGAATAVVASAETTATSTALPPAQTSGVNDVAGDKKKKKNAFLSTDSDEDAATRQSSENSSDASSSDSDTDSDDNNPSPLSKDSATAPNLLSNDGGPTNVTDSSFQPVTAAAGTSSSSDKTKLNKVNGSADEFVKHSSAAAALHTEAAPLHPAICRDVERYYYGASYASVNYAVGFLQDRGVSQYPSSLYTLAAAYPPIAHSLLAVHVENVRRREGFLAAHQSDKQKKKADEKKENENADEEEAAAAVSTKSSPSAASVPFSTAAEAAELQLHMHRHVHATNANFGFMSHNAEAFAAAANKGLSRAFLVGNSLGDMLGLGGAQSPTTMNPNIQHYYLNSPLGAGLGGASLHSGGGGGSSPTTAAMLSGLYLPCVGPPPSSTVVGSPTASPSQPTNVIPRDPFWYYQTAFVDLPANVALGRDRPAPPRCSLTPSQWWALHQQLPLAAQRKRWRQVYNSRDQGFNMAVMRRLCQDQIKYGDRPCVLVMSTQTPDHIQSELACALQLASLPKKKPDSSDGNCEKKKEDSNGSADDASSPPPPRYRPPTVVGAYFSVAPFKDGSVRKYFGQEGTFVFRSLFPAETAALEAEELRRDEAAALRAQELRASEARRAAEEAEKEKERQLRRELRRRARRGIGQSGTGGEETGASAGARTPEATPSRQMSALLSSERSDAGGNSSRCVSPAASPQHVAASSAAVATTVGGGAAADANAPSDPHRSLCVAPDNARFISRTRGFSFAPAAQLVPPTYTSITAAGGDDDCARNKEEGEAEKEKEAHACEGDEEAAVPIVVPKLTVGVPAEETVRDATEPPLSDHDFALKCFKVPPREDGPELEMLSQYGSPQSSVFRPMLLLLAKRLRIMIDGDEAGMGASGANGGCAGSSSAGGGASSAFFSSARGLESSAAFGGAASSAMFSAAAFTLANRSMPSAPPSAAGGGGSGTISPSSRAQGGGGQGNVVDYCGDTMLTTTTAATSASVSYREIAGDASSPPPSRRAGGGKSDAASPSRRGGNIASSSSSPREPQQYLLIDALITELAAVNKEMGIAIPTCVSDALTNGTGGAAPDSSNATAEEGAQHKESFSDIAEALLLALFPPFTCLATRPNDYFIRYTDQQLFCGGGGEGPAIVLSDDGTKAASYPQCDTFGSRKSLKKAAEEDAALVKRLAVMLKLLARVKEYTRGDYAKLVAATAALNLEIDLLMLQKAQEEEETKEKEEERTAAAVAAVEARHAALAAAAQARLPIPTTEPEMDAVSRIVHFYANQLQQRRSRSTPYYYDSALFTNKWATEREALLTPTLIEGFALQQAQQKLLIENDKLRQVGEAAAKASAAAGGSAQLCGTSAAAEAEAEDGENGGSPTLLAGTITKDMLPLISSPFVGCTNSFATSEAAAAAGYSFANRSPSAILAAALSTNNDASGPFSLANLDAFFSVTASENKSMAALHFEEQVLLECGVAEAQLQTIELWEVTEESF